MKTLKKLTLKKETIASLNSQQKNELIGGNRTVRLTIDITLGIYTALAKENSWPGSPYPCPQPSHDCTKPPKCCDYGCCETIGC